MKDSQETNLPIEESKLEEAKMPVTTPTAVGKTK